MGAPGWSGLEWPRRKDQQKKGPVQVWYALSLGQQAVLHLVSRRDPWLVTAFGEEKDQSEPLGLAPSMSQGSRESELFQNPILPEQPSLLKEIIKASVWTFWADFHISKIWSTNKNKKYLLTGRKTEHQRKESRFAKWAYSSENYMSDWVSWEPSSPQSDILVFMFFFQRNVCFHVKLVRFISQKKIFISGRRASIFWDLKIKLKSLWFIIHIHYLSFSLLLLSWYRIILIFIDFWCPTGFLKQEEQ